MKDKAKKLSWFSKLVVILFCLYSFFFHPTRTGNEIIQVAGFILLSFSAIDVSIIIETFLKTKNNHHHNHFK